MTATVTATSPLTGHRGPRRHPEPRGPDPPTCALLRTDKVEVGSSNPPRPPGHKHCNDPRAGAGPASGDGNGHAESIAELGRLLGSDQLGSAISAARLRQLSISLRSAFASIHVISAPT